MPELSPNAPPATVPAPSDQIAKLGSTGQRDYAYYRSVFRDHPMPFAFLDRDLLDANIRLIASRAGGKRIRIASKSVRSVAVLRHILASDACFQGIMCFTASEAVFLVQQGFDDLLMGYPIFHEHAIALIAKATLAGAHITLMVDSVAHIDQIERVAQAHGVRLPVCIELDMSLNLPGLRFGVWRSPIHTAEQAQPVIQRIRTAKAVYLDGIMGYEAQVAGLGDKLPGAFVKNAVVRRLKQRSIHEVAARRAALVALIAASGISLRFVNGGGTGSLATTRTEPHVTEITVGSGFYAPGLFDHYRDFRYQPAAGYAIEIVRQPSPGRYTCLGGGYIASGAVGLEKQPTVYLPTGARLEALEGAGEVQTPIRYAGPVALHLGDPIFLRHSKAGELCERFTQLLVVANGAVVDTFTTYRGDGKCFL